MDKNLYYHGIVRGSRPDGFGIMFHINGNFSVRGRFANGKLSDFGRVELENGEIYDGMFRNGIFSSGIFYNSKNDAFIYGNFQNKAELFEKGRGYPYKLF